jgi:hypothetical protein
MKLCQKTKSHWRQFKGSVVDELLFIRLNYSNSKSEAPLLKLPFLLVPFRALNADA